MTEREMMRKKAAARKARKERERKARNRRVVVTVALMLVVCIASIGGTIAWLTDSTETVQNTFSPSGIDISLTETFNADGDDDDVENDHWEAQLVPGKEYAKNPVVKVEDTTDVDVYLFVKFEEENNEIEAVTNVHDGLPNVIQYTNNLDGNGWTKLTGEGAPSDVWYRVVKTADTTKEWHLIGGDKVTINSDLTKEMMPDEEDTPSLTYTAYAIQYSSFEPEDDTDEAKKTAALKAWNELNPSTDNNSGN